MTKLTLLKAIQLPFGLKCFRFVHFPRFLLVCKDKNVHFPLMKRQQKSQNLKLFSYGSESFCTKMEMCKIGIYSLNSMNSEASHNPFWTSRGRQKFML